MHSQLKISQLSVWLVSTFLALILSSHTITFLMEQDQFGPPEGVNSSFSLIETPPNIDSEAFIDHLNQQANSHGVNIYKMTPGEDTSGRVTDYYLFSSPGITPIGNIDTGDFPSFTSLFEGRLIPGESLEPDDTLGTYAVQGSIATSSAILASLEELGATGYSRAYYPTALYWVLAIPTSIWLVTLGVLYLTFILTLCQLLSTRSSIRAARSSFGYHPTLLWMREAGALLIPTLAPSILFLLLLSLYSLTSRSGYRTSTIAEIAHIWFFILLLAPVVSLLSIGLATYRYSILSTIQGQRPHSLLATISIFLLVVGSLGALISTSQNTNLISSYQNSIAADNLRNKSGKNIVQPIYGYALQTDQGDEALKELDSIYPSLEIQDGIFINSPNFLQAYTPINKSGKYILTNPAYLKSFTEISEKNLQEVEQYTSYPGGIAVLVPKSEENNEEIIKEDVLQWLKLKPDETNNPAIPDVKIIQSPEIKIAPILNEVAVGENFKVDPIIVVVSHKSEIINISSLETNGASYDIGIIEGSVSHLGISDTIISYESITSIAQIEKNKRLTNLIFSITGNIFSILALLGASWVLASSLHSQNRRQLFIQLTAGESFWKNHQSNLHTFALSIALPSIIYLTFSTSLWDIFISILLIILNSLIFIGRLKFLEKTLSPSALYDL